ncbi:hypothetical protein GCM10022205_59930 [Spinactinospora alkalitolerans]
MGELLGRLVQRVVDLLPVKLGHDVKTGFGCHVLVPPKRFRDRPCRGGRRLMSARPARRRRSGAAAAETELSQVPASPAVIGADSLLRA